MPLSDDLQPTPMTRTISPAVQHYHGLTFG
jgi:hypothetical protein